MTCDGAQVFPHKRENIQERNTEMDPNTATKVSGCFLGIPGKRQPQPAKKSVMHLAQVVADLHFVLSEWWNTNSRPRIANSDRSFWGMLDVRRASHFRTVASFAARVQILLMKTRL